MISPYSIFVCITRTIAARIHCAFRRLKMRVLVESIESSICLTFVSVHWVSMGFINVAFCLNDVSEVCWQDVNLSLETLTLALSQSFFSFMSGRTFQLFNGGGLCLADKLSIMRNLVDEKNWNRKGWGETRVRQAQMEYICRKSSIATIILRILSNAFFIEPAGRFKLNN